MPRASFIKWPETAQEAMLKYNGLLSEIYQGRRQQAMN